MRTIIISLSLIFLAFAANAENGELNVEKSNVTWKGSKVGGSHNGNIQFQEGSVIIENGYLAGGTFIMDMSTISNNDLTGGMRDRLLNHLKSDDFFSVEKFPTSRFETTEVKRKEEGSYEVTGNITIKGITEEITFPARFKKNGKAYEARISITLDRSKFNVRYGSASFFDDLGDRMIYDDFDLEMELVFE